LLAAAPTAVSPYEGDALNLSSRSGFSLFQEGKSPLGYKFDGKLETLFQFQADLKTKADLCKWDSGVHDILNVEITRAQIDAARVTRDAGGLRPRQNSLMMFECLYSSLIGDAKDRPVSEEEMTKDGPTLLYCILTATFTATFSSAQSTRENLSNFEPRRLKYDVPQINSAIRVAIKKNRSAGPVNNQEIFHYQFKIYKKIKSPTEWTSYLMHLENTVGTNTTYTPEQLYTDVENHHSKLVNQGVWKPSDRSPEEQAVAMIAQGKAATTTPKTDDKSKTGNKPPFWNSEGKDGETKKWKEDTYYYCPSKNHRNGHWHKHKPEDCNTLKKESSGGTGGTPANTESGAVKDTVTIDKEKIMRGMAALFPDGNADPADLAAAFMATLTGDDE
jgi:hypothetical protein